MLANGDILREEESDEEPEEDNPEPAEKGKGGARRCEGLDEAADGQYCLTLLSQLLQLANIKMPDHCSICGKAIEIHPSFKGSALYLTWVIYILFFS